MLPLPAFALSDAKIAEKRDYGKKKSVVFLIQRTNCKIVPYSIKGDYKFRSKNLKITFGKPLDVSKMTVEEANELLFNKVKKLLIEAEK